MDYRNEMINYLLNNDILNRYFDKVQEEFKDDFKQEIWLTILEKIDKEYDRMVNLYLQDKLGKFVNGIVTNQLISNNSPFYTKYKDKKNILPNNNIVNFETIQIKDYSDKHFDVEYYFSKLLIILNNLDPYDSILFKMYYGISPITNEIVERMTYKQIANEIGMKDFQSIRNNIIATKKIILQKCQL